MFIANPQNTDAHVAGGQFHFRWCDFLIISSSDFYESSPISPVVQ